MNAAPTWALGNTLNTSHPALFFFFFKSNKAEHIPTFWYAKYPLGGGGVVRHLVQTCVLTWIYVCASMTKVWNEHPTAVHLMSWESTE